MIKSFRYTNAELIFARQFVRKFPREIQQRAFMKLNAIDAATTLEDLRLPPSNRLESLKGIEKVSTVFGSTINGESVFCGKTGTQSKSKLPIIIEEQPCARLG